MEDIFDFKSMEKPYSGWYKKGGGGPLQMWINKSSRGLDKIVFQNSGAAITDVDVTKDGILGFWDNMASSVPSSRVWYNMSTVANQSNFYMARHFIYYGWYN